MHSKAKALQLLKRLSAAVAILIGAGLVVLTVYGLVVKTQAESLLRDLTSLRVGGSGEAEGQRLAQRHTPYVVDQHRGSWSAYAAFRVWNRWGSSQRRVPP